MRLALLCDDPAMVPWLDAMASHSTHEVVAAAVVSSLGTELLRGRTGIRLTDRWEDLLIARDIDAILVGGHEPVVLEAIKQLATAGHAILFLPEAAQGSTFLYELSLIRDDNRVNLFPVLWHRHDPALVRLRALLRAGSLGAVKLIQLERTFCRPPGMESLPQAIIDFVLLPDIDLLRWLGGDYNQVTALRTGAANEAVLMQTVTLAGRDLPEATWHMQATTGASFSVLTVHAERGRTVANLEGPTFEWTLIEPSGTKVIGNRVTAARERLDEIEPLLSQGDPPAAWPELLKVFETLDATQRSVKRRRTIELHFEPMSERATFKTQMTAMGCGVLVATLLLALVYLAIASLVPQAPLPGGPPDGWERVRNVLHIGRVFVFAPPAIFLVLQLLYPLTRPTTGLANEDAARNSA